MDNQEIFDRLKGLLFIIAVILALLIMAWVPDSDAGNPWDGTVTCQSPKGEIRQFPNYTCPPGWWQI